MAKIYTIGEILVEIMRTDKNCQLDKTGVFLGPYPSGAPAIFISTAAQLGNKTKIWGGVGKDKFGSVLIKRLEHDGVDISEVTESPDKSTAVAFVAYKKKGDREYIFTLNGSPASDFTFKKTDDIPDCFHVMGCSLMVDDNMNSQINNACKYFYDHGAKISFDPNIRPSLLMGRDVMDVVGTVMGKTSVLLLGLEEMYLLSEGSKTIEEASTQLFNVFPVLEIIHLKLGKKGSRIITKDRAFDVSVYPIEKMYPIVDPTGAGDSFDAAFISSLAKGLSLEEAGKLAAKAGAINSITQGPMGGKIKEMVYTEIV